ncbi:TfuA-like protein [Streptomyces beihaiensis]|uniref:TfuA-like protein n=1 Tax=Streptomyces beihaiensis TaxID=2984495 RepID=A0ABT3U2W0_9ACTN|nr:TfuA-like protein [Streptomyces beihaiensis]MCX3063650.1 TfuA-like protein [Streptomyces beihaiensis]
MTTHVYVGPSLSGDDVLDIDPYAVVHPPLRAGDLLALRTGPDDAVVVVDGAAEGGRAQPDEFIDVLGRGTRVLGAAAAGALYAAELWPYGMQGVGAVFAMYAEETLDCDDEVAVAQTDGPGGPRTPALVDLRWALAHAVTEDLVEEADAATLVELVRTLPCAGRTWDDIVPLAHKVSETTGAAALTLRRLFDEQPHMCDLQRQDARTALEYASRPPHAWRPFAVVPPQLVARTVHLERRRAARRPAAPDARPLPPSTASEADVLSFQQLYAPDFPARYRRFALALIAGERLRADERGLAAAALESARRRGLGAGLLPAAAWAYWLTPRERRDLSVESQLLFLLVRSLRGTAGAVSWAGVPEELRGPEEAWAAGERAVTAADCLNRRADGGRAPVPVRTHLEKVWRCTGRADLTAAARDRGFACLEDAERAARRFVRLAEVRGPREL